MLNKRLVTAVNEAHLVMTNQKGLNYEDYRCPRCSKRMMLVISQQKMPFFKTKVQRKGYIQKAL